MSQKNIKRSNEIRSPPNQTKKKPCDFLINWKNYQKARTILFNDMGIISQNMGVNVASRIMVCSTVNRKSSKSLIEYYTLYTKNARFL